MGSSYTWCNSTKVTQFLSHRFIGDLMDKNCKVANYSLNPDGIGYGPNMSNTINL